MASNAEQRIDDALKTAMLTAADRFAVTGNPGLPDDTRQSIESVLFDLWRSEISRSGREIIGQFKDCYLHLETKDEAAEFFDLIVAQFIEDFGAAKVQMILETTREQMLRLVAKGQREGLGVAEIAKDMREAIPGLSRFRAHVIARTETHTSAQYASNATARASRYPLRKRWESVEDYRTRDFGDGDAVIDEFNHRGMDGIEVGINDVFMVPKKDGTLEPLEFPGDPRGSAGNVINCRCVQTYERIKQT